ncbi:uncharacterized protein N7479_007209 [Penicillium vulpinum]|uniref:GPI anchored protein n=1 Tax=Penicillium vulpinum TaxID=29845 RepID=A0A1V6S0R1_9EURO|nr:uncharacterized protein N7479_007209 [Penicillium vulpinum]KAJ5960059.1 hypothetical protein N7479_007209 [Penicillium vulpinum]OQE07446.1 hypothetical protein PENVUL_c013G03488 [Penicillium vulpinum]
MKGFIGGIPVALLAVAAQAKFVQERNSQPGGTAIGGPSGDDADDGFVSPYSVDIETNTQINEWSKDDHSIKLKHTDVYPGPTVAPVAFSGPQVPGMGPFGKGKRSVPAGTAIGGPSGNDEGQSFDMSVTGIFNTELNEYNKDDHSIDIENKHVYPAPVILHPPPHFHGPASEAFNAPEAFGKRSAPPGGTAIGGPSGNDGGQSFSAPTTIETTVTINEHNEDDHSIELEHEDTYAPRHGYGFVPFRRSEKHGPFGSGGVPPLGHFESHPEFHSEPHVENHPEPHYSPSYESNYEPHTSLEYELTSIKNNNNGPAAGSISVGRRAYAPTPDDGDENEDNGDNQGVENDSTDPSVAEEDEVESPQCSAQVHEVVHTVTKTLYKTAEATHVAYQSAPVMEASATPFHAPQQPAGADPMMNPYGASAPAAGTSAVYAHSPQQSAGADAMMRPAAASSPADSTSAGYDHSPQQLAGADPMMRPAGASASAPYNHVSHRPMSHAPAYSMIAVNVPQATPASSAAYSNATPDNVHGKMMPGGLPAEQSASPSASASASVSHGTMMFEGNAARLSGGFVSAAAAVMGVLAFIL